MAVLEKVGVIWESSRGATQGECAQKSPLYVIETGFARGPAASRIVKDEHSLPAVQRESRHILPPLKGRI